MINSNVQHDQIEIQKNQIEMWIYQINGWFVSIQCETPVWHNIASYIIWFDIMEQLNIIEIIPKWNSMTHDSWGLVKMEFVSSDCLK